MLCVLLLQVATVGLSITIPLAMISDFILFGDVPTGLSFGGAAMVIVGFLFVVWSQDTAFSADEVLPKIVSINDKRNFEDS